MMLLPFLIACAPSEFGLSSTDFGDDFVPVGLPGDGSAIQVEAEPDSDLVRESFVLGGGVSTPLVDFLFVVDDSASMANVVKRFQDGFQALVSSNAFPSRARVAVTSMIPQDPTDPVQLHPAVQVRPIVAHHPGFGGLVDADRIAAFRSRIPRKVARRFKEPGCAAWFAPDDVDAQGDPCLLAHTQLAMVPFIAEAGLTAFEQLLLNTEGALFRSGAAANVIFVSDTHDPGFAPGRDASRVEAWNDLVDHQPDFASLDALVADTQTVSSFRIHAIAPRTACSERWSAAGPVYLDAVEANDGVFLDICTADDYAPFIQDIVRRGSVMQSPVLALSRSPSEILAVTRDGEPAPYRVSGDGRAVLLSEGWPTQPVNVQVVYR